jgi:hypothetical protein
MEELAPGIVTSTAAAIRIAGTYYCCCYDIPFTYRYNRLIRLSIDPSRLSPPLVVDTSRRGVSTPPLDSPRLARRTLSLPPLTHARLAFHVQLTACLPSESHAPTVPGGSCPTRRRRALHRRTSTSGRGKRTTAAKRPCSRNRRITAASSAPKDT